MADRCFVVDELGVFGDCRVLRLRLELGAEPDGLSLGNLPDHERARAERYQRREDRVRFVAARAALRERLANELGVAPRAVPVELEGSGRPFIARSTTSISLSHSGCYALVALRRSGAVGVDVEQCSAWPEYRALAASVLHPDELATLERATELEAQSRFFRSWTSKEAALKALGTGLGRDPRSCRSSDGPEAAVVCEAHSGYARERVSVQSLDVAPGYAGAVAWREPRLPATSLILGGP